MADRFFIGPVAAGFQRNLKPWMIPDQAYETLNNVYEWRGRLRKRFGTTFTPGSSNVDHFNSRARIMIDTTDGAGAASGNLPLNTGDMTIGMMFSIGNTCYTISALGNPATIVTDGAATFTIDTTASPATYSIAGGAATTDVYFYPCKPIMGINQYDRLNDNDETTIVFDTRFAYTYDGTGWDRIGTGVWSGTNSDFFWTCNWLGAARSDYLFFAVNYVSADGIQYWDGTNWATLTPIVNSGSGATLNSARIILPFQNRLIMLNTIESTGTYTQRCRFSQNGDPTVTEAFYEDVVGRGGYVDATTRESIVSAAILRDRLIVYFERSTWELVYTNNQALPFVWQQINTSLGAESPHSVVAMDEFIFGVGNTGIHACNGTQVDRIDEKIPDETWELANTNNGVLRVAGIRDFFSEVIYWTIPLDNYNDNVFPTQILMYNYKSGSWARFDDTYTAFGYIQYSGGNTWAEENADWFQANWSWDSYIDVALNQRILAGNQQGFLLVVDPELSRLASSLLITDIDLSAPNTITVTALNHNLNTYNYIMFENMTGTTELEGLIFQVETTPTTNTFTIIWDSSDPFPTNTYTGCGTIALVSPISILTKEYNFYHKMGSNISIDKVDFNVDFTASGEITVDAFPSFSFESTVQDGQATGAILGTNILETFPYTLNTFEANQNQGWHPVYFQAQGEVVQLYIYHTPEQARDPEIVNSPFTLNAAMYYVRKTSSRFE